MSWLFSQALVAEYLEEKSLGGKQLQPWKLKDIHVGYSCSDKTIQHYILSQYGRTLEVSPKETIIADHLLDDYRESMIAWLFPEDSHARTFQWLGKVKGLTEKIVASGGKCTGWFAKYDPQQSIWKTPQCSLIGGLIEYSDRWPKWGIMQSGVCWELPTLELTTIEKEYGLWPTPTVNDAKNNGTQSQKDRNSPNLNAVVGGRLNPTWVEWLMGWPINWTDININIKSNYEYWKQIFRKKTGTKKIQDRYMPEVWWQRDPSETSYRQQSNEQFTKQHRNPLFGMSQIGAYEAEKLGSGASERGNMQNMWEVVSTEADKKINNMQSGLFKEEWPIICDEEVVERVIMSLPNRVDRLKAIGNGQVPRVAAAAYAILNYLSTTGKP
jgi:hypothetical protein